MRQHFARVFNAKEDILHPQPFWFYLPVLLTILLPWTPLALAAHPRRLWADQRARFFVVWLAFGFVLFSLSSGKLPGYLLPLLPAASALLGISVIESTRPRFWLAVVAGLAGLVYAAPNEKLLEYIVAGATATPVTPLAWAGLAGGLLVGWWAGGAFLRTFAVVALLMGGLRYWAAGIAERHTARPYAAMAGTICAERDLHRAWRYGLSYYGQAPPPDCQSEPRRWQAGNSESGLYLSDTAGHRPLPYP